jgi:elongation factor G
MVRAIAETDDALTLEYLEGEAISVDELRAGAAPGHAGQQVPRGILRVALRNKGIQLVLDAVVDYLPSPQ